MGIAHPVLFWLRSLPYDLGAWDCISYSSVFGGRVIHFLRFSIRGIFHVFGDWNHDFLASGDRSQHSQYSDASNHEIQTIPRFWA